MDIDVLERYFQNECSAEEAQQVSAWFKTPEGEQYLSDRIEKDLLLAGTKPEEEEATNDHAEKLFNSIWAAKDIFEDYSLQESPENSSKQLIQTLPSRHSASIHWLRYAAVLSGLLIVALALWGYYSWNKVTEQTAFGETKTLMLPDGSTVVLNGNSKVTYRTNWQSANIREVWLEGEAYFSITHLPDHKRFVVNTSDNFNVEVLGTTFNVLKRDQKTKVVLNTGKIKLTIRPHKNAEEHLVMVPGELVEFDNISAKYTKRKVNPETHSSWKSNKILFENTSFSEIILLLEHTYGLQVELKDTNLLNQKLNGTIPTENVDVLLEGLSHLFSLRITRNNQQVIIENE